MQCLRSGFVRWSAVGSSVFDTQLHDMWRRCSGFAHVASKNLSHPSNPVQCIYAEFSPVGLTDWVQLGSLAVQAGIWFRDYAAIMREWLLAVQAEISQQLD